MFISRLYKLNILKNHSEKLHLGHSIQINKLISSFFSSSFERNVNMIENLKKTKVNTGECFSFYNAKFPKIEFLLSNLEKYSFKNFDEDFYPLLMLLHRNLLIVSKTQCRKIPNLYSTIERIRFKIFKLNSIQENYKTLNEAKGILFYIYLLEKKNIYNITREENNSIMPKILKFMENNHSIIRIVDLIEIIQIMSHFGIAFNLKLVEERIKEEIKFVNFDHLNHIIKNFLDNKNSKLNYFKTIILNKLLTRYIETGLKENIKKKLSLIANLTGLCIELPLFDANDEISLIMHGIQREFLLDETIFNKLDSNSILNLFETINNMHKIIQENFSESQIKLVVTSGDFSKIINMTYDHISTRMIFNDNISLNRTELDKLNNKTKNSFFNLPLLLLFIKHVSSIESHLLPKEYHIKVYFRYIKNNLTNSQSVHRESLFCYKLMERASYFDSELAEMLRKYLINEIHLLDAEKYPLKYFINSFKKIYDNDNAKLEKNILQPLSDNLISLINFRRHTHNAMFFFRLFISSCVFSKIDNRFQNISDKIFSIFLTTLRDNKRGETLKECCKILEYFVNNRKSFNLLYEDVLNETLISIFNDNRDQVIILDLITTKVIIYLDQLEIKEESKTFAKREELIRHILDSKHKFSNSNLKILNELRMLAENKIIIHPNSLFRVICFMKEKNYELKGDQLENLMKLIYIILKKSNSGNSEWKRQTHFFINELISFIKLKSNESNLSKINIYSTIEIVSKILKTNSNELNENKLFQLYDELQLQIKIIPNTPIENISKN